MTAPDPPSLPAQADPTSDPAVLWWRIAILEPGGRTVEVDAPSGWTLGEWQAYAARYHGAGHTVTPIAGLPKPRAPVLLEEALAAACEGVGITPAVFRSLLSPEDVADIKAGGIHPRTLGRVRRVIRRGHALGADRRSGRRAMNGYKAELVSFLSVQVTREGSEGRTATIAANFRRAQQFTGGSWRQIALAKRMGVPKALGLSVEDWVNRRLHGYVRRAVEDRRDAPEGESTRAIAEVLWAIVEAIEEVDHGGGSSTQGNSRRDPRPAGLTATTAPLGQAL